jgi:putative addiction module component (TIGR02574 family)
MNRVLQDALSLPPPQRAKLAVTLIESLDDEDEADIEKAWATDISRRVKDLDSGAAKTVPWSIVRRQIAK